MKRSIVKISDDNAIVLRTHCDKAPLTDETQMLVSDLFATLAASPRAGVGLSAPQIGVSLRVFVVNIRGLKQAFVNPHIRRVSENETSSIEGCLSLPGVEVNVTRPKMVWVDYYDEVGKLHSNQKFKKMEARIIQHEYDHLNGVLITDYRP